MRDVGGGSRSAGPKQKGLGARGVREKTGMEKKPATLVRNKREGELAEKRGGEG